MAQRAKYHSTVCRKSSNFFFILSNIVVDIVIVRTNAIRFIFFEADVRPLESESLRDVSVNRFGDTFPTVFSRLSRQNPELLCPAAMKRISIQSTLRAKVSSFWYAYFFLTRQAFSCVVYRFQSSELGAKRR